MKFEVFEDVRQQVVTHPGYIKDLSMGGGGRIYSICRRLKLSDSSKLCDWLNTLNNQGLAEINCESWTYVRAGYDRLSMTEMSTGEVLYLLVYAADKLHEPIYIRRGLRQLSDVALRRFLQTYRDSEYITVLCVDKFEADFCKEIMEGKR